MNAIQFDPYFRVDAKVNYLWNKEKVTHRFAIGFVNLLGIKYILTLSYAPDHPDRPIVEEYQIGFLPVFYYKLDF